MNRRLPRFILCALLFAGSSAAAQVAAPDEAIAPDGAVMSPLALTPAQRAAIYTAVTQQRVVHSSGSGAGIAPVIGAPVPPSARLGDLPYEVAFGGDEAGDLKYAMVADDVVVVDPIRMRVVDVIHAGGRP
jgi:hypothetical protein